MRERFNKKLTGKANWFKKKKKTNNEETETCETHYRGVFAPKNETRNKPRLSCAKQKVKATGKETQATTVMFVPRTPGGELIARLKMAEEELGLVLGDKVKLVERTGKMLKRMLNTTNPPDNTTCSRPSCLVCSQAEEGGGGNCRARNITY